MRGRWRAPLALQIVVLFTACLVLTQLAIAVVVVVLPPPPPQIYRLGDIAAALGGGLWRPVPRRPLKRAVVLAPPRWGEEDAAGRRALAVLMGVGESQVRLRVEPPNAFGRISEVAVGLWPGPTRRAWELHEQRRDARRHGVGAVRIPGEPAFDDGPLALRWRAMQDPGRPLFGRFVAATRRPNGEWVTVEPEPEPFPSPWQMRVLAWLVISLAITVPAAYLFARRITAPLRRFARAADRFGSDPNAPLMELDGPAEIGAAAFAFNGMQRRLKRFIDDRTAMVGAISHDLRTPLSRIRFKLEKAPPALRQSISSDLGQMEEMIASVLEFIRDAQSRRTRDTLDLASVLECVVDDALLMHGEVSLCCVGRPFVRGDPVALQRLFANLVDNAVKYAGGASVLVREDADDAVVVVSDNGPGLPDAELDRVFEPFYRSDASRNLDVGGIGLGLAVARSLAREHGGDIVLTSSDRGLDATVWLPLSGDGARAGLLDRLGSRSDSPAGPQAR